MNATSYAHTMDNHGADGQEDNVTTFTVSIDPNTTNQPIQRKVIPADYEALLGDLEIPDFKNQDHPYHVTKKLEPDYGSLCAGLTPESLKYFKPQNNRRRRLQGPVVRNLNSEFERLSKPSPNSAEAGTESVYLPLPHLTYNNGYRNGGSAREREGTSRPDRNHLSNADIAYGAQTILRRKPIKAPVPPVNVSAPPNQFKKEKYEDETSCRIV